MCRTGLLVQRWAGPGQDWEGPWQQTGVSSSSTETRGFVSCVCLRGELLALFTSTRICVLWALTHAIAWYGLITISGAH